MSTRRAFLTALAAPLAANAAPPRSQMGIASTCYMTVRRPRDAFQFLEYCLSLGAGGIQISLNNQAPDYLRKLRTQAEKHGMYIEVMAGLPRSEHDESFQRTLQAAKEVGALCVRSACLGGRRYETFASIAEWQTFTANSHAAIRRAVPIAEKIKMPWAIENHKDWTVDEFVAIMKQYSSEYFGCCLDTGNNLSLLDDAMEVVERLAPYAISSHLKDMAAEEYSEGFLLAEVPFGEGMLDIARMTKTIRNARPTTKITLEMITRDPLKVPVLTEKYWATFPDRGARRLAATLKMIRGARHTKPIPLLTALPANAQLQLEEDNVKSCLNYARERLAL
ncbi:MAG TPA: sugar phosphate isomerase/epimerase family protein [Bryobacteraceae bacterium]|nr:sugar phosphate isomerase/epimerase family protein [Bryobacteraceae bacterium]